MDRIEQRWEEAYSSIMLATEMQLFERAKDDDEKYFWLEQYFNGGDEGVGIPNAIIAADIMRDARLKAWIAFKQAIETHTALLQDRADKDYEAWHKACNAETQQQQSFTDEQREHYATQLKYYLATGHGEMSADQLASADADNFYKTRSADA